MFYVKELELVNFNQFKKRGVDSVKLDFTTGINIFKAPNGYGKSSIMKEIQPFAKVDSLTITDNIGGSKRIVYGRTGDTSYNLEIFHSYVPNKKGKVSGHFIKTSIIRTVGDVVEELNDSGSSKVGIEVLSNIFHLTQSSLKATGIGLRYGRSTFNFLETDNKGKYEFVKTVLNMDGFVDLEKRAKEELKDVRLTLKQTQIKLEDLTSVNYEDSLDLVDNKIVSLKSDHNDIINTIDSIKEGIHNTELKLSKLPSEVDMSRYLSIVQLLSLIDTDAKSYIKRVSKIKAGLEVERQTALETAIFFDVKLKNLQSQSIDGLEEAIEKKAIIEEIIRNSNIDYTVEECEVTLNTIKEHIAVEQSKIKYIDKYALELNDVYGVTKVRCDDMKKSCIEMRKEYEDTYSKLVNLEFNSMVIDLFSSVPVTDEVNEYTKILDKVRSDISDVSLTSQSDVENMRTEVKWSMFVQERVEGYVDLYGVMNEYPADVLHRLKESMIVINNKLTILSKVSTLKAIEDEIDTLKNIKSKTLDARVSQLDAKDALESLEIQMRSIEITRLNTLVTYISDYERLCSMTGRDIINPEDTTVVKSFLDDYNDLRTSGNIIIKEQKELLSASLINDGGYDQKMSTLNDARNNIIYNKKYRDKLNIELSELLIQNDDLSNIYKVIRDTIPMMLMGKFLSSIKGSVNSFIGDSHSFSVYDIRVVNTGRYEFIIDIINDGVAMDAVALSSGEQAILLLSMMSAFMSFISEDYGILRLDELDSTLDDNFKAKYIEILLEKAQTLSQIFVITHNGINYDDYENVNVLNLNELI